jgi:hypothetical protein
MGVGLAVLTETKLTDDCHTCLALGYKVLASKAASHNLGGIALLWKENHPGYEVELVCIVTPNLLTFQLATGSKRFYCMGIYIPPTDTMGVDNLWAAWEACPMGCVPVILGDLNINFRDPRNEREELIVDLLDNINRVDMPRQYTPRRPRKQSTRTQWTWRHKREGRTDYLQLDYIFARKGTAGRLRNVGFCWPRYHDLDHQAVITAIRTRIGWLTAYRRKRQEFPLKLPPKELQDNLTQAFEDLKASC